MKNNILIFWVLVWVPAHSCINKVYLNNINGYLNASDTAEKSKYMAENYHSFFINKKGICKNKSEILLSFKNWDGQLHPEITIINYSFHDSVWEVEFNEQNDISKAIHFPGWKGRETFIFNSNNLIEETVYIPDSTNLSFKPFLQPALDWLQKNMPDKLSEVYQNNKLIQTETAANKWEMLLNEWQAQRK
ncbi:MAG: hypothetical protein ABI405_05380 [Parafilimonas sp.]